jgi:hypothetical protein
VPRCLRWPSLRRWGRSVHRVIHPEGRRLTCVYTLLDETSLEPACGDGTSCRFSSASGLRWSLLTRVSPSGS